jgi:hypothetical protein
MIGRRLQIGESWEEEVVEGEGEGLVEEEVEGWCDLVVV